MKTPPHQLAPVWAPEQDHSTHGSSLSLRPLDEDRRETRRNVCTTTASRQGYWMEHLMAEASPSTRTSSSCRSQYRPLSFREQLLTNSLVSPGPHFRASFPETMRAAHKHFQNHIRSQNQSRKLVMALMVSHHPNGGFWAQCGNSPATQPRRARSPSRSGLLDSRSTP